MTNTISINGNPMSMHSLLAVRPRFAEFGVLGAALRPVGAAVGITVGVAVGTATRSAAHTAAGGPPRGTPR